MSPRGRLAVLLAAAGFGAGAAGMISGTANGAGAAPTEGDRAAMAAALTREPAPGVGAVAALRARAAADDVSSRIPLPAGGTFSGIQWEKAGGVFSLTEVEGVLEYNAACQWLRARRDGRDTAVSAKVLDAIPSWPALRGTDSGKVLGDAVRGTDDGPLSGVLRDCDTSHREELTTASEFGLPPSS